MKKQLRVIVVACLLAGLAVAAWHGYRQQQAAARMLTGTVEVTKADVTAKTSGYIKALYVKEGAGIHQGDKAAAVERRDLEAALLRDKAAYEQAQAKLAELAHGTRQEELAAAAARTAAAGAASDKAARDMERATGLLSSGAIAQSAYDDAAAAWAVAAAQLKAARADESRLVNGSRSEEIMAAQEEVNRTKSILAMSEALVADLLLYSPVDGVVLTRNFEQGEYVNAGAAIATIANLADCWVKVYVSPAELARLQLGQQATVLIDGTAGERFVGRIKEISDKAEYTPRQSITKNERANMVFAVKVAVDNSNGRLKPGMPADVIFDE